MLHLLPTVSTTLVDLVNPGALMCIQPWYISLQAAWWNCSPRAILRAAGRMCYDCFLSHAWDDDSCGRNTHARVMQVR